MKEKLKEVIIIIVVLLLLTISAFSQNQFSDYVNHQKSLVDGYYMYVTVNGKTEIIQLTDSAKLDAFIRDWLGVRYKLGGSTKKGIDCSQFTKRLYRDVYNLSLENVAYKQWIQTKRIKKDSLRVGDIVFFRSRQSPSGWHCGIYIGNKRFVHAANKSEGVRISTLDEPRYLKSYRGAGRLD
jgi:lipoprotein Spr